MTTHPSAHSARLSRIEQALIESIGLFRCLQLEPTIDVRWKSQVEAKKALIHQAAIDVMQMQSEVHHEEQTVLTK